MGIVNFGIPSREVLFIKELMGITTFVEGGTFRGGTAQKMSPYFERVYTIENSQEMFDIASVNLKNIPNIKQLQGDTRDHLQRIISNHDNILYWLDAHWSGGVTYGKEDECPLIDELKIIFNSKNKNQVILIDDARLFLAPPPSPHKKELWPSMKMVFKYIPDNWDVIEYNDVIYLFAIEYSEAFLSKMQEYITDDYTEQSKKQNTLIYKILAKLGMVN